jgi:hypothetical protein
MTTTTTVRIFDNTAAGRAAHLATLDANTVRAVRLALTSGHDAWLDAYAADRAQFVKDSRNRWKGSKRAEYRRRLFAFQHGVCLKCGGLMDIDAEVGTDTRAEWGHMMTARRYSNTRSGFRWGNVGLHG